jgi:hypothetical protein
MGLTTRIVNRLKRKHLLKAGYILVLRLVDIVKVPSPAIELEIKEVGKEDEDSLEALAKFDYHGRSKSEISQLLSDGQRCFIAKHRDQVVSCYWALRTTFWEYRRLELAENEEYQTGGYTLPEFRGNGILPYFWTESWRLRAQTLPDLRILIIIEVRNKASLRSAQKVGFRIVGRIGLIELFGIQLQYLLGRNAFPKTTPRFLFEILS